MWEFDVRVDVRCKSWGSKDDGVQRTESFAVNTESHFSSPKSWEEESKLLQERIPRLTKLNGR